MAVIVMFLMCGFLEGMSGQASVFIQPNAKLIFAVEPGQKELKVFDLEGHRLPHRLPDFGIPINACEGQGKIFITYLTDDGDGVLLICDTGLQWKRKVANASFYYPNTINGKLFGLDYVTHSKKPFRFPLLAHEFDVVKSVYGPISLFKLPQELQHTNRFPEPYWLFQVGDTKIALMSTLPNIFVLSERYLKGEAIESQNVPSVPSKIKLGIANEFKNSEMIELHEMELYDNFAPKVVAWMAGRTRITAAWELPGQGILFCYGELATKTSKAAFIGPSLSMTKKIKQVKGIAMGGMNERVWTALPTDEGLWIDSFVVKP